MAITDGNGFPVAVHVASASPHETRLVAATIEGSFTSHPPEKPIGDLAYDSDPLDETLKQDYGVELIAPHKSNRRKPRTQGGRALRRYCRRWKIERFFAWLPQFQTRGHSLGIPRKQLPRHGSACLYRHPAAEIFMRWLLVGC